MLKIFSLILRHKFVASLIVLVLLGGGYWGYTKFKGNNTETRYALAAVEKGTLITSVSGSGQISVSNQVDVSAKAAGDLVYLNAKVGQEVKSGALLAQVDASAANKSIRDAEANLESAKLSLEKLNQPTDALSILQAENTLTQAKESKQNAEDDLEKAYEDSFTDVANAFLDLPTVMTGLNDIIYGYSFNKDQINIDYYVDSAKGYDERIFQYKDDVYADYQTARTAYDKNFDDYRAASRSSSTSVIEALTNESYDTAKKIADAVKCLNNLIQFYEDRLAEHNLTPATAASTHLSNLNTYTGKTNTHISNLLSIQQTIQNDKQTIVNYDRTIAEKTESLANLKAGADPLDIKSQELSIQQKENALLDAKEKLADYYVRAPFDGIIASVAIEKGDSVSASTAIATLITKQRLAEISLNEVDVAKVKVGQKATLTFDAVSDLNLTGAVAEIDTLGTVSQGVVTYNVKIVFDTQDERIKPGMSVSAAIVTDIKTDVLLVPNAAVKSSGDTSYVEMLDLTATADSSSATNAAGVASAALPRQQTIQVGLANDASTEVVSGLKEGDQVVTSTVTATATNSSATKTTSTSQNRGFGIPGLGGGMRD